MLHTTAELRKPFEHLEVTLNPEKCSFMLPKTQFLGHKLNVKGII